MVITALACFAVLLVAWILAPDERRPRARAEPELTPIVPPDLEPELASAA